MNIEVKREDEKILIKIIGRVDTVSSLKFQTEMDLLLKYEIKPNIEIDCSELEYISSQGLRVFLLAQKTVATKNGEMILKNMKDNVKEVFDITGFTNIIKIIQ